MSYTKRWYTKIVIEIEGGRQHTVAGNHHTLEIEDNNPVKICKQLFQEKLVKLEDEDVLSFRTFSKYETFLTIEDGVKIRCWSKNIYEKGLVYITRNRPVTFNQIITSNPSHSEKALYAHRTKARNNRIAFFIEVARGVIALKDGDTVINPETWEITEIK